MCGISGFLSLSPIASKEQAEFLLRVMNDTLTHRGPDDSGIWCDPETGIGLGHRRLSVLDLSAAGHQPMVSPSGRFILVFNGEIYNHLEIRQELEHQGPLPVHPLAERLENDAMAQHGWRGHTDTETLLAAMDRFGVGETLKRCRGMFAFALWDRHDRLLYLARDRLGEKPLYYGWQHNSLLFGSELKALRSHPEFSAKIDRDALAELLRLGYVPGPSTIFQDIRKLPPGTYIAFGENRRRAEPVSYWSLADAAVKGQLNPFLGSETEAIDALDQHLHKIIEGQRVADVPLGAFLSGGIDSSLVTAILQARSPHAVRTFSIGFNEPEYNEAPFAKAVAEHLGTQHTELIVDSKTAMEVIAHLPRLYDEPFADVSQIPTHLVARLARQSVTVALSGDGGDELFGGYNRHTWTPQLWRRLRYLPQGLRHGMAGLLRVIPPAAWDTVFRLLGILLPAGLRYRSPGDKLHKLSKILGASTPEAIYLELIAHTKDALRLVKQAEPQHHLLTNSEVWPSLREIEHRMMFLDSASYLPDDILVKLDRATMGASLEARAPLLDHRLVEFGWTLPLSLKIREGQGKWILRQLLNRYVPPELIERPKMGFGVPIDQWLRGPLKDWAEPLIESPRLKSQGYFHPGRVAHLWKQHLSGRVNHAPVLWSVLMFQAWLDD